MNKYISLITNALFTLDENSNVSKYEVLVHEHTADKFPFPHHKHDYRRGSEVVTDSFDISLAEVLTYVYDQLTNSKI